MKLFEAYTLGTTSLKSRIVMAPLTRSRATQDHIPTPIMATYYAQRASAGLIITEGTAPSPNGTGYARIPGMYNTEQIAPWKNVTEAVHQHHGKIFLQIMHTGRVSHPLNMPENAKILAPSAIALKQTKMYTDQEGEQPIPQPSEMTMADIQHAINEYVNSAKSAMEAGFDGVELHAANGYLIEQFLSPASNARTDSYGGSVENRCRFVLEIAQQTATAIGAAKVGIRISPYGVFNEMAPYPEIEETYKHLASALKKAGLVYIHIVDHSSMGAPEVPQSIKESIREAFGGTIILSGGYDKERAEHDLKAGLGHLIAFGRPFISNPNLPEKLKHDLELREPDYTTFYTPGEKGYTDY
ncbi:MAG: alkene reductase [Bacteroidota bacterium]